MALRGMISVTTILLCLTLALLHPTPAASSPLSSRSCCTRYNRNPVPFHRIRGYKEQSALEHCRKEAIIFYTVLKKEICVSPKDEWVKKILQLLSSKLNKMSKGTSAAANIKDRGNPSIKNGGGVFLTTTDSFLNSTDSLY